MQLIKLWVRSSDMRKALVAVWILLLCSCTAALFWYNEWVYSLPTPIPKKYTAVPMGSQMILPGLTTGALVKPVFLHFFNPDCPCSRFNIEHVKLLIKLYGEKADFKLVLVTQKNYTANEIQKRFGISIPVLQDNSIAASCGVYSTPQAVIIDNSHKLYYRGNYNRSRYCSDKKTNYAQTALESLLQNHYQLAFDPLAVKAYGCQLPGCKQ